MPTTYFIVSFLFPAIFAELNNESIAICKNLNCDNTGDVACGLRVEETGFRLKLFENECELLKYGCDTGGENAYGLINKEFCESENQEQRLAEILLEDDCACEGNHTTPLCAIRKDGEGFRVRWFENKCELVEYNCRNPAKFVETDKYVCENANIGVSDARSKPNDKENLTDFKIHNDKVNYKENNITNLVIVKAKFNEDNINDTIDKFFATTHIYDVPLQEVHTRRKWIKNAGPINVFIPMKIIPKNLTDDYEHIPLMRTCLHKCPTSCPSVYAPVCGQTSYDTRSPTLMFQNHCFMDVASCRMYWEDKGSSYWESLIVFCLGDEMDAAYRFIPAIRTLQKMGRLKKKGKFRRRIKNFRYLTDIRSGPIKPMG
ncbi:uncharacterized protein LOC121733427 [Aricia agestis]|uniref:uncharacterized protein LOC121733427 n=1 Tax=Aricia agestis TaxID=91739 RepID=UPI001C202596|nr:uncharacterized protein LOC121733427 [Aricia agestis]